MKGKQTISFAAGSTVLLLGAALMAIGIHNGEAMVVLQKAIKICFECIGIG
jgi:hypothetical protein